MKESGEKEGVELREGEGLVRTTIVGGQPRKRPALRMTVKVGLERVLYLAATDRDFRTALLVERDAALRAAGLSLSDGEQAILAAVDGDALAAMIDAVKPRERPQRPFLKSVAATFLTLATGTAQLGCPAPVATGIEPDRDFGWDPGAEPDIPVVTPDLGSDPGGGSDAAVDALGGDTGADVPGDTPVVTDDTPMVKGILADVPAMDVDVEEIYPDGGTQPDVLPFDASPEDVWMDADAPVVGGILPDEPSSPPEAALPRPAPEGGRA